MQSDCILLTSILVRSDHKLNWESMVLTHMSPSTCLLTQEGLGKVTGWRRRRSKACRVHRLTRTEAGIGFNFCLGQRRTLYIMRHSIYTQVRCHIVSFNNMSTATIYNFYIYNLSLPSPCVG